MTGIEQLRKLGADAVRGGEVGRAICDIADQIERERECERDTIENLRLELGEARDEAAWVREHGGLDSVKKLLDWVVGHCSTRQQLDFDFWLSGRVMYELGFDEDMADRDEVERRLLARLMPDGMEWLVEAWPRYEDSRPVRFSDDFERYGDENGVSVVTMYSDGSFALNFRSYSKGERVNRPAPKVPDADALPVHGMWSPSDLTHERPESKCRDCAHWQKDPTADNMDVCWFFYHEHEGQDCYAARRADIGACEEFMPCAKALAGVSE